MYQRVIQHFQGFLVQKVFCTPLQSLRPIHFFTAAGSVGGTSKGGQARFELGPASQQASALPSELRCTLLSYAAPYLSYAASACIFAWHNVNKRIFSFISYFEYTIRKALLCVWNYLNIFRHIFWGAMFNFDWAPVRHSCCCLSSLHHRQGKDNCQKFYILFLNLYNI